jgi:hypothetical protein
VAQTIFLVWGGGRAQELWNESIPLFYDPSSCLALSVILLKALFLYSLKSHFVEYPHVDDNLYRGFSIHSIRLDWYFSLNIIVPTKTKMFSRLRNDLKYISYYSQCIVVARTIAFPGRNCHPFTCSLLGSLSVGSIDLKKAYKYI